MQASASMSKKFFQSCGGSFIISHIFYEQTQYEWWGMIWERNSYQDCNYEF